jgi:hypothetical protein
MRRLLRLLGGRLCRGRRRGRIVGVRHLPVPDDRVSAESAATQEAAPTWQESDRLLGGIRCTDSVTPDEIE